MLLHSFRIGPCFSTLFSKCDNMWIILRGNYKNINLDIAQWLRYLLYTGHFGIYAVLAPAVYSPVTHEVQSSQMSPITWNITTDP